jgi:pimeloyl-ACP methyl ester carboxylesterase
MARRTATGVIGAALLACRAALTPAASPAPPEPVTFPTADSGVVSADVYGRGPRGVVLAHGGRFTKASWATQARAIADAGFRVVAIDFRGRGESRGGRAGADSAHLDVLAAVRHLRGTGATSVSVVGASFGGWAAANAVLAAAPGEIERLALLAHSPVERPEGLTGRKLFIVSGGDTTAAGVPRLVAIRDQYERAPAPKELVVLGGSAHAQLLFATDQGERLLREILRFLGAP